MTSFKGTVSRGLSVASPVPLIAGFVRSLIVSTHDAPGVGCAVGVEAGAAAVDSPAGVAVGVAVAASASPASNNPNIAMTI